MYIRRISGADNRVVANKIGEALRKLDYDAYASPEGSKIVKIEDVRLSNRWVKRYGYNISPYTGHRGRILGWKNWVQINNTINKVLDKLGASANISSRTPQGKFKIREGKKKFTEEDWEERGYDNVGSVVNPVQRRDAWLPEAPERVRKKLEETI